jgi:glycosyltransferase involved in cell wall biosynthesis
MSPQISAIICTHNRAAYLRKAVRSLELQTLPAHAFEILVIDNCSTDETKRVVVEEFSHLPALRYIYEPKLGLSQARNTGWMAASAPYLAFLDDDAVADPAWLEAALDAFSKTEKPIGLVGGPVRAIWECPRPDWLPTALLSYFTILESPRPAGFIDQNQLIAGANMVLARRALEQAGGFSTKLGRKGSSLLSAEEVALRERLTEAGYLSYYAPSVSVQHHIPAERVNKTWLRNRVYWGGVSDTVWWRLSKSRSVTETLFRGIRGLTGLAFHGSYFAALLLTRATEDAIFLRRCRTTRQLGKLQGLLSRNIS